MLNKWACLILFCGFVLAPCAVFAQDVDEVEVDKEYKPGKKWKEDGLILPEFPQKKNLVPIQLPHARYDYFIDIKSITLGKGDRVARYTVVIRSKTNAQSIYYEGIQCHNKFIKQFAYGVAANKQFKSLRRSSWRPINGYGANKYREVLADEVFCLEGSMRTKLKDVVQTLKYPPDNHAPEYQE